MDKAKILLDTDLGSDCDDAGALAVLHNLADLGKVDILAVAHCASEISGAVTVKVINEWYGRGNIPVGRYDKGIFLEEENCVRYTRPIMNKYLKDHDMPRFESSVRVMRKALSGNDNVTMVVIGMLNNIAELLKSKPDDISPLNGVELVKKSVKDMYVMGGNFEDLTHAEWNIRLDIKSSQYVAEHFPMPVIYCGFEIGADVITGIKLENANEDNPVRFAYYEWLRYLGKDKPLRNSWDPITVYCAAEAENSLYDLSGEMTIGFDDNGRVVMKKGGKDRYIIAKAGNAEVQKIIDELLV